MRLATDIIAQVVLVLGVISLAAASTWGFEDATVSVNGRKTEVGTGHKERLFENKALPKPVTLAGSETLKVVLTAKEDRKPKRPHQAFLRLEDRKSGLDTSFALTVRDNGKGKLELSRKDLPHQLLTASGPLAASLIIASLGSAQPYHSHAFDLSIEQDSSATVAAQGKPLRYGKLPEIHHTFKTDPKSPPKMITLAFTAAVLVALPVLLTTWLSLGANLNHLPKAFGGSPLSHALFLLSIFAMEAMFFLYYTSWNLFQTLPAAVGIGLIAFLSGSRALTERAVKAIIPSHSAAVMGSSSSKAARTAASATKRRYPQQASPATTNTPPRLPLADDPLSAAGPNVRPQPKASDTRDESINLDASDPQFAASLRSLGPVTPSSTLSNSSHFPPSPSSASLTNPSNPNQQVFPDPSQNPAILVLTARENLAKEAEAEFARVRYEGGGGRRFLDIMTVRQVLMMRDEKHMTDSNIEQKLGLAGGVVKRLGTKGVVAEAGMGVE